MMQNIRFKGITALVTGASRGIGAATALGLAARGAFTLVHYHTGHSQAEQLLNTIRQSGGDGALIQADLSCSDGIHHFLELLRQTGKPVDILVNNAGSLIQRTRFLDLTEELWNRVFTLNVTSAFDHSGCSARHGEAGTRRGGKHLFRGCALRGGLGAIAYSSAKGALSVMTKGLAREFAPQGVRLNAISPGTIDTDFHRNFSTPQGLEAVAKATPSGRIGTSAEVADAIIFLCSEEARFIQGQVIEVNGGFLMV